MDQEDTHLPLWGHINELRTTLLYTALAIATSTIFCFFNSDRILTLLQYPLQGVVGPSAKSLVLLSPLEGILIAFKISFWAGLVASSPIWLFITAKFIFPGLKDKERRLALYFAVLSIGFAATGILFSFYVTLPLATEYLFSFNQQFGLNLWSLENYLNYTLFLMLGNALAFELGAIGIFAVKLQYISLEMLVSKRRHAVVCAVILGALLTPPDVLTQSLLAIPLVLLYEGMILYARSLKVLRLWGADVD